MGGFQQQVNYNPAPGVEGDFCSTNPRAVVLAGPGGLVAGDKGLTVGRFAWTTDEFVDDDGAPAVANNFGSGPVAGFVHRAQQGLIELYLQESSMLVPAGFPVTLFSEGDFFMKNSGDTAAYPGMKAYANFADGKVTFAATGSPAGGGTSTASTIAAGTASVTGGIENNVLTVTEVASGTLYDGVVLSGTDVETGTQIVEQLLPLEAGEALRGVGRYAVSIAGQNVADGAAISATYGLLTIGGTVAGTYGVGQPVSGGTTSGGTVITDLGTGAGGAGTYIVNNTQTVSSAALNTASNVETAWVCRSTAEPGEIAKTSKWPQG